jgi:hypothetical protein
MNVSPVARAHSVLASSSIVRPSCSGRSKTPVPTSWHSQWQAFIPVLFLALAAFPACVSAAPTPLTPGVHIEIDEIHRRNQDSGSQSNTDTNTSQSSDNSISMNVWVRCAWCLPCCEADAVLMLCPRFRRIASDSDRHRGVYSVLGHYVRPSVCGL